MGVDLEFIAIGGFPKIKPGDDLPKLIVEVFRKGGVILKDGDVIAVAQTVVSKAEGRIVDLRKINPSPRARAMAQKLNKDPREVEVILRESEEIVRLAHVIISRTKHGFVCANAGVDKSNVGGERVTILPENPDASAARIREKLKREFGVDVAVLITDTQGRAFRRGCVGVAIGVSGMEPLLDLRGRQDLFGRTLRATITSPADAIAAAAVHMMGEAGEGTPVVLVRGAAYPRGEGSAGEIARPRERDLFK
jgi:coenzyme F420-0:L-glutamate ligase/coenzyme F420-1:gamma-L-glutamate ligase